MRLKVSYSAAERGRSSPVTLTGRYLRMSAKAPPTASGTNARPIHAASIEERVWSLADYETSLQLTSACLNNKKAAHYLTMRRSTLRPFNLRTKTSCQPAAVGMNPSHHSGSEWIG